ncbi:SusC/RagA family TonB-linked outer membrane protein [Bacteroides caecigallinarum]|uniref:SusC/RagA family TonB-linked outer membrane protein n=1 Tax=Bacteroides caecigallinarum TaxID=1411144 RepID=UPI00195C9139|nr:SusC/RagA family TonB-linked outer membrane protein [Bacteroides caecigallinarum]MBM6960038.1 SusC/RagA family TonB-linked outer membrane protein [Bacteroides caecigallinarum]
MQKRFSLSVVTFLVGMFLTSLYAQAQIVQGTVTDKEMNEPLIGVNVLIKGTTTGTVTDFSGNYSIEASPDDILVFSYVSMKSVEETVGNRKIINVVMESDAQSLGEVVVTAMGIKRQSETLTYSAQTVGGKDVNDVKSVNMINALQGKSAGLQITPNSTGAGGSSKIQFRGSKSISGSNQPLIVVDGVPVMTTVSSDQVDSNWGGQRDGGDVMSTINPDDIASITLLKGASAAALYGAVAANGAIMITTKSAQSGKVSVNVSSNTTMETPMLLPEFQNNYGMSDSGTYSWGNKLDSPAPNYLKKFYRTGFTTNNSISLAGGNENIQSYFSYGNVYSQGITPTNDYRSHNLSSKVGFNVLKNIHVDFNAKFVNQYIKNQAAAGYLFNPLTGAYLFPRGEDWDGYKENFEVFDPERGINVQNWTNVKQEQFSNPYWVLNRQASIVDRNRYEFGGSVKWDITPDFNIQGRMRYERGEEHWTNNLYASSSGDKYTMGRFKDNRYFSDQLYGDVLLNYNHTFNDFMLSVTAGSSFTKSKTSHVDMLAEGEKFISPEEGGNVYYPNIFAPNNYYKNLFVLGNEDFWNTEKRLNAVFATAQVGWRDGLFLDLSARNDWSSALAYTESCSFFYPSVGASLLLDRFVDMGKNVNLLKLRGSYSIVGNDVPVYVTNLLYHFVKDGNGAIGAPENAPFRTLKPEKTHSMEFGFEGTFFQNRLTMAITYYKTNTKNQFFSVSAPYQSGLRNRYVNAGDVQNQGFEFTAGWYQQFNDNFSWSTDFNISYNENIIKELVDELPNGLTLTDFGGAKIILKEGGQYGDLYVRHIMRDENGKPIMNEGKPVISGDGPNELEYAGNMNSKVFAGWTNTFYYKDFSLSFLIDARFGGKVLSMTEATLDGWGVSKRTGDARDAGKVVVDGVEFDPKAWYTTTGCSNFNTPYANENYVYDATNVRLRELSFGYTFRNLFGAGKNLTAAVIGRNLFFFYKDAPMDPDISAGTGNGIQGVDMFGLPTSRSFGLNLKLNF